MATVFFVVIFSLLLPTTIAGEPISTLCSNSKHYYTANTPFDINLKLMLSHLKTNTSSTGFGRESAGLSDAPVNGLCLCRGDVLIGDCTLCVENASEEITTLCPKHKAAIIWYERCYLKYSDDYFFGKIDDRNIFCMCNQQNVSDDSGEFKNKTRDLLSRVGEEAAGSVKMYESGEVVVGKGRIYGMAQCSRDLSQSDCRRCADEAVNELLLRCDGKVGGRLLGGSCSIRYDRNPFPV